jgi:hypothetical protein
MDSTAHPRCKHCRRRMASVTEIAPIGRDPGLIVLVCTGCGTADSVLVHPLQNPKKAAASSICGLNIGHCRSDGVPNVQVDR